MLTPIPPGLGLQIGPLRVLERLVTEVDSEVAALDQRVDEAGGITNGEAVVVRAAMKPISTTLTPLRSVDLADGKPAETRYERSDICPVPRAVVVGEAMLALTLANALLEKLGGDSLDEIRPRFDSLRRNRTTDLPMDQQPWRFGYSP